MPRTVRLRAIAGALAVSVLAVPVVSSAVASGDPISDKRAEAARIAAQLDDLQHEAEVYTEQYNDAVIELQSVKDQVAQQQKKVTLTQKRVKTARRQVAGYAIGAYTSGSSDFLTVLSSTGTEVSQRKGYQAAAMGDREDLLDRLRAAQSDNTHQSKLLAKAKDSAGAARDAVAEKKDATESAVTEQRQISQRVQGELADLVAKEQARRAAIAARKAREAAARAAAAQQARHAAAARAAAVTRAAAATTTSEARRLATSTSAAAEESTTSAAPAPEASEPAAPPEPDTPDVAPPPVGAGAAGAVSAARSVLGVPYKWAGGSPSSGFDCSGLVMWAWGQAGKGLPHSSAGQYAMSRKIPLSQLQPGDIVAYNSPVSHIGLYIGGGQMIHAPHTGDVVRVASIYSSGTPRAGRL